MIEIVFSDSAGGSLKMAQNWGEGAYSEGCMGVIINHPDGTQPTKEEIEAARLDFIRTQRLAWENAHPLGGNPGDVYCFHLSLSIGDISEDPLSHLRLETLKQLWSLHPDSGGKMAAAAGELFHQAKSNLKTVTARALAGEPLRIWYSDQPDEMCGMYWFLNQLTRLSGRIGEIFLVRLPEWETDSHGHIIKKSGWGETAPHEWHKYLTLQKPALPALCQECTARWQTLMKENAPLRAVLNGVLVSAQKNLYDSFIIREIEQEKETFSQAVLIGRILGKYQLGISDSWVALRMEEMISSGLLIPDREAPADSPTYHRRLKKSSSDRQSSGK